ncbi:MAG TPA: FAD-binding protein [Candidatus Avipropionibacterium avicola]|uniref:FAD-binding protein n=1 Tax=Candidatus Avipropionibacterium avicola TaxID=2840701 RepID=A0A9D1KLW4_9ACTN|nr:FAD-binding protein [Candidatus Avipropionibacterium avicola]
MTSTVAPTALAALASDLPDGVVATDPAVIAKYRTDWSRNPEAVTPDAVVRVTDAEQVQQVLRWASRHRVAVIPRGAGTGLSGGSSGIAGAVVLSLERMIGIEIDVATRTAIVEPGALNIDVKRAAAEHGLWYPPDPSSYEICSIGGNLATNAGGLCCVKYGVTTDYVLGMDVVLADGTLVRLGGPRIKDSAGLSLVKMFVGSEGTLGVFTRAVLRLVPALSPAATMVATFHSVEDATRAVVAIGARLRPSMLEYMDQFNIRAVERLRPMGLDTDCGAMLLAQSDAAGSARLEEVALMSQLCAEAGAKEVLSTDDPDEAELFVAARRASFHALEPYGAIMFEDVGVPIPELPRLVTGIAAIAEKYGVDIPVVAHAGDGNTHPNVIHDASDPDSVRRARLAFDEVMDLAITLGGTITGEHGVGRLKRGKLADQLGPGAMDLTRRIKDALDPDHLLNPGAIL